MNSNKYKPGIVLLLVGGFVWAAGGCSRYVTPGRGANLRLFSELDTVPSSVPEGEVYPTYTDSSPEERIIRDRFSRKPAANLPARLLLVRVQAPDYCSKTNKGLGCGSYSVVIKKDIEANKDYDRIADLPDIVYAAPLSRLLTGDHFQTDKDLRVAASALQADMILVYTIDTIFQSEEQAAPLSVVSLGLSPTVLVHITSNASALLMDTRTGFIYGAVEDSAKRKQVAAWWTHESAIDQSRRITEREAFEQMLTDFERMWPKVVTERQLALYQR